MSIKVCKNFNLCIKDFINELLKLSKLRRLQVLSSRINTLLKINICSTIIINTFIDNILPEEDLIMKSDSQLFTKIINKEKDNRGEFLELMLELNNIWSSIKENNRRKIFEYLLVLNFYAKEHIKQYIIEKNEK